MGAQGKSSLMPLSPLPLEPSALDAVSPAYPNPVTLPLPLVPPGPGHQIFSLPDQVPASSSSISLLESV